MRKGQSRELIELLTLVIGITVLLIISYYFLTSSRERNMRITVEEKEFNRILDDVTGFFYNRIPVIDKNLAQVLGDCLRWCDKSYILYGKYYGGLNVKEVVEIYFNSSFGERWHLETFYNNTKFDFGYKIPSNIRLRTFIIKLPVPKALTDGEVVDVKFTQW